MLINVSTLLQEPVGSARVYRVVDEPVSVPEAGYRQSVSGRVHLLRTERGVLVSADFALTSRLECARCVLEFEEPVRVRFDEEYVAPETVTGQPTTPEVDEFRIDEWRHLDLSEAVRQYEQSALPLLPLHSEDCAGLCPICGQDWNERRCSCEAAATDSRWGALSGLAEQLRTEESHGAPEA